MVEVVGVDVRDQRDRGVVEQERAVGLVGLDDEQLAGAASPSSTPSDCDHAAVDEARVGAEPSRPVTIMPVEVVLPCAPATETRRCSLISQASACERCSTGMPALQGEQVLGVVRPERAGDDERVGVAEVRGVVADVTVAPSVASAREFAAVAHGRSR